MSDDPGSSDADGELKVAGDSVATAELPLVFEQDEVVKDATTAAGVVAGPTPGPPGTLAEAGTSATAALIEVACGLQDVGAKQDELREMFESRLRSDEVQAKALEKLSDQLRDYKVNFIRQEMQPLLRDLIFCYDYAADEVDRAGRPGPPPAPAETARAFDHLRQMVADVLAKYDVEPFRVAGPDFDRREQQCVRTVPTAVEGEEKKIAAVGAVGFRIGDQIVRKEQVTVYKFTPPPRPPAIG